MTDAETTRLAQAVVDDPPRGDVLGAYATVMITLAKAVLSLLPDQEGRGEVVEACPECKRFDGIRKVNDGWLKHPWYCGLCGANSASPAYYQRVPAPKAPVEGPS